MSDTPLFQESDEQEARYAPQQLHREDQEDNLDNDTAAVQQVLIADSALTVTSADTLTDRSVGPESVSPIAPATVDLGTELAQDAEATQEREGE